LIPAFRAIAPGVMHVSLPVPACVGVSFSLYRYD
jgi:hypothetical protein